MKVFMVSGKKMLAVGGVLLLLGMSAGCSERTWEKYKATQYRMVTGKSLPADQAKSENQGSAETAVNSGAEPKASGAETKAQQKINIVLYFADRSGDSLMAEKREIALVPGLARAAVQELINGPAGKGLSGTIPEGTKLLDVNIENGLCRVDFSRELREKHWGGSSGEILTVYSLVNTLTQFATVDKVEILVEGKKIETLAGHMDLSAPVYRNSEIIRSSE